MQTVWNRVAQTNCCCRCPQCVSSAKAVSRRAVASAPRRIPRYFTTSTFVYTSIFAAAATYDAGNKQERREQWDRAIESVKQELGRDTATARSEQTPIETTKTTASGGISTDKEDGHYREGDITFRHLDLRMPKPRWPSNTGPPLIIYNLPPQSVYAAPEVQERWSRALWTRKKVTLSRLSMDTLQLNTFLYLRRRYDIEAAAQAVPAEYAAHLLQSEDTIRSRLHETRLLAAKVAKAHPTLRGLLWPNEFIGLCNFAQDASGEFAKVVKRLNAELLAICGSHLRGKSTPPAFLAQLMHCVCTSKAPPNYQTYNILLEGLMKTEHFDVAGHVIGACRGSNNRPNEDTLVSILKYCRLRDDSRRFAYWVKLMYGEWGGLSLAHPDVKITDASEGRLLRHPNHSGKVIQLPYPTPRVMAELLQGILKFTDFGTVLDVRDAMGEQGWGLCMRGMAPLLSDCAKRVDWESGLDIWRGVVQLKRQSVRRQGARTISERIPISTFAAMTRLCENCQQTKFHEDVLRLAGRTYGERATERIERANRRHILTTRREQSYLPESHPLKQPSGVVDPTELHQGLIDNECLAETTEDQGDATGQSAQGNQPRLRIDQVESGFAEAEMTQGQGDARGQYALGNPLQPLIRKHHSVCTKEAKTRQGHGDGGEPVCGRET